MAPHHPATDRSTEAAEHAAEIAEKRLNEGVPYDEAQREGVHEAADRFDLDDADVREAFDELTHRMTMDAETLEQGRAVLTGDSA